MCRKNVVGKTVVEEMSKRYDLTCYHFDSKPLIRLRQRTKDFLNLRESNCY